MWTTHIYTKGGYEWEVLRIPFYHFFQQHQDAKVMNQTILPMDSITGLRFRIQDDVQGPFKFELDYIATTYDTQFRQFHNKGKIKANYKSLTSCSLQSINYIWQRATIQTPRMISV